MGPSSFRRIDTPTVLSVALSIIIFVYAGIRAAKLCITIDEAATYLYHVKENWIDILLFRTGGLPDNNHLLNTLLCKLSVSLFGLSELTLRIPALFGCFLYLLGLNLSLRQIVSGWKLLPGLLAIGLNPYVIDFLGLARGYGLGLGFTMLGIMEMLLALASGSGKIRSAPAQKALLLFSLATLSNLSFLLVLCAAILILALTMLFSGKSGQVGSDIDFSSRFKQLFRTILPVMPFMAYFALPIHIIKKRMLFGEGGHNSFWSDTVRGLVEGAAYSSPWFWGHIDAVMGMVFIISMLAILALPLLRRTDEYAFTLLFVLAGMVFIVSLGSVFQHYLFNIAYLEGRRGIFLIPLFLLMTIALGNTPLHIKGACVLPGIVFGLIIPSALAVHNISCMNLSNVNDWNFYQGTRPSMLAVKKAIEEQKYEQPRKILMAVQFEEEINFYREMFSMERMLLPAVEGLDGKADFYYGYTRDAAIMKKYGARPLFIHSPSDTVVYERVSQSPGS